MKKLDVKSPKWLQDFKDFINQGSVIDLAVGVVIGGAFGKIVSSLVADIIMPIVGLIGGGVNFTDLYWEIPNFFGADTAARINYGNFLQNVVDFLIIAFAIFIFVRIISRAKAKMIAEEAKKAAEEEKQEDENTQLLREIRDALVKQKKK